MKKVFRVMNGATINTPLRSLSAAGMRKINVTTTIISSTFSCALLLFSLHGHAQADPAYEKMLTERTSKIVQPLGITDSSRYHTVMNTIVHQYEALNDIHEQYKSAVTAIKGGGATGAARDTAIKQQEGIRNAALRKQHQQFIGNLTSELTVQQVEQVKDGMTYRVLPVTYGAYQDMLPGLTAVQKEQIYAWLLEARELAMDEGTSDDKHKVFGKYKGRINNYLAAAGYDLKKETDAWQQRLKDKKNTR
ncbi:DUF3826 domain-containing protein [Chitinophaga sp. Cy-1792]|uniref:DUF3826 domain-containing protein n=1 Tax=Chitinophaga sp. Cy-1792 TaxID=2608339 RepID=UPI00141F6CDB|nr:DUF3826 domain-containing protein [Chitinophaga sp. Cy-1792]NIG55333.1 DUF3826 domain-containing protein [Chitinophaga sp. Cy-1792]